MNEDVEVEVNDEVENEEVKWNTKALMGWFVTALLLVVSITIGQLNETSSSSNSETVAVCDTKYGAQECETRSAALKKAQARANKVGGVACVEPGHNGWYHWYVSMTDCR